MSTPTAEERAKAILREAVASGRGRLDSDEWANDDFDRLWPMFQSALHAHAEAARAEERWIMSRAAANVFSHEIDALGELEKVELAEKIDREAAALRAEPTEP